MFAARPWIHACAVITLTAGVYAGCGSDEEALAPPETDAGSTDASTSDAVDDAAPPLVDSGVPDVDAGPCSADGWCVTELSAPNLEAIWGSGPNDIWAVGWFGTIVHWDGTKWTRFESGTEWPLFGIWGSAANDVWAVGRYGTVLHWDGTRWAPVPSGTTVELVGVWGNDQGDLWAAVGLDRAIMHKDPSGTWSRVQFAGFDYMVGVSGVARSALWLWGDNGVFRWNQEMTGPMWNITSELEFPWWSASLPWDRGPSPVTNVWFAAPDDLWILSERGDVYHWRELGDGGTSSVQSRVPPSGLGQDGFHEYTSLWGSGPTDVWASGQLGRVAHLHDSKWTLSPTSVYGRLFDCTLTLWGAGADDVWTVGKCGDGRGVALRRHR